MHAVKPLYPEIEPYATHWLEADGHRIYFEECGNPKGLPVIYLHGGPGSGCQPDHRRLFDPEMYRIILVDQRGAGRSQPAGHLKENTTWKLVDDLEAIRQRLKVPRWIILSGSWGAALALAYAQTYPIRVMGMILRGTFLARQRDLEWFVGDGVRRIYPDYWNDLIHSLPVGGWNDFIQSMYKILTGHNETLQMRVAAAWHKWSTVVTLGVEAAESQADPVALLPKTKIELHYAAHQYFLEEDQLLRHCDRIRTLPCIIIHGRRDLVCPVESAYALRRRLPGAELQILEHSGHIAAGEEMIDALVQATERMAERLA